MPVLKGTTSGFFVLEAPDRGPALSLADIGATGEGRTGNKRFVCPLCDSTRKKKNTKQLSVDMATGAWQCWHCGEKGLLTDYWTERPKLNPKEQARERLRKVFSITPRSEPDQDPDDADWRRWLRAAVPLVGTPGEAYLAGRGIPLDLAAANGVTFIRSWYGRPGVVYPLLDAAGAVAAVGVRYVTDGDPKTRVRGKLGLGAFAAAGALAGDTVVIVEGPADALSLGLCGVPAVALHRVYAPDWLVKQCAFKRVLVALDADTEGDKASPVLVDAVSAYGAKAERLRPPAGKDWNDALREWGVDRLRRVLFDMLARPRWQAAFTRRQRPPHPPLESAIDTADWQAFCREIVTYEAGTLPTIVQEEMQL